MAAAPVERTPSDRSDLQWMSLWLLALGVVVFAVSAAIVYRPSFDGPANIALAILPFAVFAAAMVALIAQLRPVPTIVYLTALVVALGGWAVLMFDNDAWFILTFVLFAVCFGAGRWLGIALAGLVAVIWTLSWVFSDQPIWVLPVPMGAFAPGTLLGTTIWRVENTKEIMRRNRELESAYLAQEVIIRQNEKLAAVGRLSAGMAHELNNPAAAAQRAAEQLSSLLVDSGLTDAELAGVGLTDREVGAVRSVSTVGRDRIHRPEFLDPLERSDRETAVQEILEGAGVDEAWEVGPSLVALGLSADDVGELAGRIHADRLAPALRVVAEQHDRASLLVGLDESIGRVIEIVGALKTYTYLDRAPRQLVDVHEGLDSTLVMLQDRLEPGIEVMRSYAADLARIEAYGSELNQVWTNIVDNAIDAMDGHGTIEIVTRGADDHVVVEFTDSGRGIPSDISHQVFDPFVTTKAPGEGVGLGLNISHAIITQKHGGEISLTSEPGRTTFAVRLPVVAPTDRPAATRRGGSPG